MTQVFTVNQLPATGAVAWYNWKTAAKASGWTVASSGDGTSYNAAADIITSGAAGGGGLDNTNAWFRIVDPAGLREYTIQRTTSATVWRVKYSASAKFTGGSPSATRVPSATDEGVTVGAGTDASPSGASIMHTNGAYYCHMMFTDSAPYMFYWIAYPIGGGNTNLFAFLHDTLLNYDAADQDPLISYIAGPNVGNVLQIGNYASGTAGPWGWLKYGLSGASFVRIPANYYQNQSGQACPSNMPSNPHSGNDDSLLVPYIRQTSLGAPIGWKGTSSLVRWRGLDRSTGSTIDIAPGTKNRIVIGHVDLPWDGTTTPLV